MPVGVDLLSRLDSLESKMSGVTGAAKVAVAAVMVVKIDRRQNMVAMILRSIFSWKSDVRSS